MSLFEAGIGLFRGKHWLHKMPSKGNSIQFRGKAFFAQHWLISKSCFGHAINQGQSVEFIHLSVQDGYIA